MANLEFRAVMGIVAIILATCSIAANFILIEMCCMHIGKAMQEEKGQEWAQEQEEKIKIMQERLERNRSETIRMWLDDVSDSQASDRRRHRLTMRKTI